MLLYIYGGIGLLLTLFVLAVMLAGQTFSNDKMTRRDVLSYIILFGLLWPIGLMMVVLAFTGHKHPRLH